jgi:hypothetical protein
MIDFLKKLFQIKTDSLHETNESRYYKDLMAGPKIYYEVKPFVKVKLRFVDTLIYDKTKHIEPDSKQIKILLSHFERFRNEHVLLPNSN